MSKSSQAVRKRQAGKVPWPEDESTQPRPSGRCVPALGGQCFGVPALGGQCFGVPALGGQCFGLQIRPKRDFINP